MGEVVVLEWTYTPHDFFEEPISIQRHDCLVLIESGRVTATVQPSEYDEEHRKRDELHDFVNNYFKSVQLTTHLAHTLPKPGTSRMYPDGRRNTTLFPDPGILKISGSHVDLITMDPQGKIIRDTKRERIDSEKALAHLIAKLAPTDPLVAKLLRSYGTAVDDPTDEFVRLYEIREAISARFGNAKTARKTLGISKSEWDAR